MAASFGERIQYVGTETTPIALGANGGADDVWTWTHNLGRKALKLEVLDSTSMQTICPSDEVVGVLLIGKAVIATQASANVITLTNQSTIANSVILRVTWQEDSEALGAPLAAIAAATAVGGERVLS